MARGNYSRGTSRKRLRLCPSQHLLNRRRLSSGNIFTTSTLVITRLPTPCGEPPTRRAILIHSFIKDMRKQSTKTSRLIVSQLSETQVRVTLTIVSTEGTSKGNSIHVYRGYYLVGQENSLW